jgi:hypothetical protein
MDENLIKERDELIYAFKKLRDGIEFGPFFGEATNLVIEADKTLDKYEKTEPFHRAFAESNQSH